MWAILEDGRIAFFTQSESRKARNLERDRRVALSVVDGDNPYCNAQIRGRVVEVVEGEPALEVIDRLSQHYIGEPFPMRSGTVFVVDAEAQGSADLPFEDK